jgi:hypothetical protein
MLAEQPQQAKRALHRLHAVGFRIGHCGIPFHTMENIFPLVTIFNPLR